MLEVTVHDGSGAPKTLQFDKDSVMIGRAPGNDICLDVQGVSRYHTRLNVEGDQVVVQDLNSTNGTHVNSNQVQQHTLVEGDKISIGNAVLMVRWTADASSAPSEAAPAPTASAAATPPPPPAAPSATAATAEAPKAEASQPQSAASAANSDRDFYWESLSSFLRPIWNYVIDDSISEIMVNGPSEIYIERKGQLEKIKEVFTTNELQAAVLNIAQYVGRRVSEEEPYMDARLPDGSRVAILMPPCSRKGTSVSIRKFSKEKLTLDRLVGFGSMTPDMVKFLEACVVLKKNVIVSGGTSSGKTSLLNVLSSLIPSTERILTIEDSAELQLSQEHVVPMETKPPDKKGRGQVTIRDLVKASLRMRPDRIVVGEIRSGEALDLLQAMNTGHSGSMATVHASSPSQALTRLETLSLFSGIEIPMRALREQVATALDIIVQASRLPDHSRKVTHISEVAPLREDGTYLVRDIYRFQNEGLDDKGKIIGRHIWTEVIPQFMEEMELSGLKDSVALFKK